MSIILPLADVIGDSVKGGDGILGQLVSPLQRLQSLYVVVDQSRHRLAGKPFQKRYRQRKRNQPDRRAQRSAQPPHNRQPKRSHRFLLLFFIVTARRHSRGQGTLPFRISSSWTRIDTIEVLLPSSPSHRMSSPANDLSFDRCGMNGFISAPFPDPLNSLIELPFLSTDRRQAVLQIVEYRPRERIT
ncbi:MAG: hypothetical protein WAW13_05225 [Minisyncoccia bacterium]